MCDENEDEVDDRQQSMLIIPKLLKTQQFVTVLETQISLWVNGYLQIRLCLSYLGSNNIVMCARLGSTPKNAIQLLSQYVTWVWNMLLPQSFPIAVSTGTI